MSRSRDTGARLVAVISRGWAGATLALADRVRGLVQALVVSTCLLAGASSAEAGGLLFVPPLRVDVAPVSMVTDGDAISGQHVLAGAHWASLSPGWRTSIDIGVGYTCDWFRPTTGATDGLAVHGVYLELADRIGDRSRHQRGWLAIRGELLLGSVDGRTRSGGGLVGRASWELFANVAEGAHNGGVVGTAAIGTFLEVGVKRLPDGRAAFQSIAGLSARVPLLIAGN